MKMDELVAQAKTELEEEDKKYATELLKERLKEIREAKRVLTTLETQFEELLAKDVADVVQ